MIQAIQRFLFRLAGGYDIIERLSKNHDDVLNQLLDAKAAVASERVKAEELQHQRDRVQNAFNKYHREQNAAWEKARNALGTLTGVVSTAIPEAFPAPTRSSLPPEFPNGHTSLHERLVKAFADEKITEIPEEY